MIKTDLSDETKTKMSASVIINQLALNMNEAIKHTPFYKATLKYRLNNLIEELKHAEAKEYDKFFDDDKAEKAACNVYNSADAMINELGEIGLFRFGEVAALLIAYKKDPASINGIVNKINKNKN